jgi:hypothetical protein
MICLAKGRTAKPRLGQVGTRQFSSIHPLTVEKLFEIGLRMAAGFSRNWTDG